MTDQTSFPTLAPARRRLLDLDRPLDGRRHVSAASGLAPIGGDFVVVVDDSHHVCVVPADPAQPARALRVVAADLPQEPAARKRRKPDFEAVTDLPSDDGRLLVVGSGSTSNRDTALVLSPRGTAFDVRARPLGPLFAGLRDAIGEINVEAAAWDAGDLVLVSRAHTAQPDNHVARFGSAAVLAWLDGDDATLQPSSVCSLAVGALAGVPLGVTDATPHPGGGLLLAAVAENTANGYDDGAIGGSVIAHWMGGRDPAAVIGLIADVKVEGIAVAAATGDILDLLMVTDADDPDRAAELLTLSIPARTA